MFLPLVFLGYTLLPNRTIKTVVLIICSLMFYSWGNPNSLILMLITILWNYFTGLELELYEGDKRKFIFWLGVAFHILVLVIYKYTNFFSWIYNYSY